jgi:hypothetical protein
MSKREDVTQEIHEFISSKKLNRVYSGFGLSKDKKYRYVLFNIPKYLDGEIRIYNQFFILVKFQTSFRDLPHNGKMIFKSVVETKEFIEKAFLNF